VIVDERGLIDDRSRLFAFGRGLIADEGAFIDEGCRFIDDERAVIVEERAFIDDEMRIIVDERGFIVDGSPGNHNHFSHLQTKRTPLTISTGKNTRLDPLGNREPLVLTDPPQAGRREREAPAASERR
jgi:hypothetical protein